LPTSSKTLREVKNQLSIDGNIDYAQRHIMLNKYDPNAVHAILVELAHLAAERGYRASTEDTQEYVCGVPVTVNYNANT
jgi:hypothetical protein